MTTRAANTTGRVTFTPSARVQARHNSHAALVRAAQDYLGVRGAWVFKVLGGLGQRPGVADLLCCFPPSGRLVAIEVKSGQAQLSRPQRAEAAVLLAAGGLFIEMRSVGGLERALVRAGLVSPALQGADADAERDRDAP